MAYPKAAVGDASRAAGRRDGPQVEQAGFKDILVHIDSRKPCPARLEAAIGLARAYRAHVSGVYVIAEPYVPGYVKVEVSSDVLEEQADTARNRAAQAEAMFRRRTEEAGIAATWICREGDGVEVLGEEARFCDVAVIGQREPQAIDVPGAGDMPDRLILSAGRPVMLVPHVGDYPSIGERVLVAWDGSRPAARAVNDALPVLRRAGQVHVISVSPENGSGKGGANAGERMCRHLARHGVAVEAHHYHAKGIGIGDLILSRAAEAGVDLIVMGAYGHARWRELVLGGVTLHLLKHMTVPVLMSH